jgi:hypothetical protein
LKLSHDNRSSFVHNIFIIQEHCTMKYWKLSATCIGLGCPFEV